MDKQQIERFIKAVENLGLSGAVEYPGVGEKIGMELKRIADSHEGIDNGLDNIASALRDIAEAIQGKS